MSLHKLDFSLKKFFELYSLIFNPLVLVVVLYLIAIFYAPFSFKQTLILSLFQLVIPILFFLINLIQKKIDIDLTDRMSRIPLLVISIISFGMGTIFLYFWDYPREFRIQIGLLLVLLIFTLITSRWKISFHSLGISMTVVFLWKFIGIGFLLTGVLLVPSMMAARVYLERHTIMQTVAGVVLGFCVILFF